MSVPPPKPTSSASASPASEESQAALAKAHDPQAELAPIAAAAAAVAEPDAADETAAAAQTNTSKAAAVAPEDASHWLYRLTAEQWLTAAENELRAAEQALSAKQQRSGVTYARRAAGMALNARLRSFPDASYGRSYMEHLQALHKDPAVSPELREAAGCLLNVSLTQQLVTLGPRGDTRLADFAARIIAYSRLPETAS